MFIHAQVWRILRCFDSSEALTWPHLVQIKCVIFSISMELNILPLQPFYLSDCQSSRSLYD